MTQRRAIRFLRKGQVVELTSVAPTQTVLDYLRLVEKSRGTKEGCNEGDCGACTVALGRLRTGQVIYEPVNACILLVAQLDGRELVTVDDLASDGILHPVQQAMVETHGSQCGFCTPGFIMALFTLYHEAMKPTRQQIVDRIAGNLCRCTGYRPIVDAALQSCTGQALDLWAANAGATAAKLAELQDGADVFVGTPESFVARPASSGSLTQLAAANPAATIVAGATDVGLWITKQMRDLPRIILIDGVSALHEIVETHTHISLGAAVTYAEALPYLARIDDDVGEVVRRIGSAQVRASGTIGGNIANGSPIGDMPPMLIALGAILHLRHGDIERHMPLEEFFLGYGKQDRQPGELVWHIDIPKLAADEVFRSYKISKRFDQDISAVLAAFKFKLDGRVLRSARIACGGLAPTPKRAPRTEAALAGLALDQPQLWPRAIAMLAEDFQPISDMRASSAYRAEVIQSLLRKALMEVAGATSGATRVTGLRKEVV